MAHESAKALAGGLASVAGSGWLWMFSPWAQSTRKLNAEYRDKVGQIHYLERELRIADQEDNYLVAYQTQKELEAAYTTLPKYIFTPSDAVFPIAIVLGCMGAGLLFLSAMLRPTKPDKY